MKSILQYLGNLSGPTGVAAGIGIGAVTDYYLNSRPTGNPWDSEFAHTTLPVSPGKRDRPGTGGDPGRKNEPPIKKKEPPVKKEPESDTESESSEPEMEQEKSEKKASDGGGNQLKHGYRKLLKGTGEGDEYHLDQMNKDHFILPMDMAATCKYTYALDHMSLTVPVSPGTHVIDNTFVVAGFRLNEPKQLWTYWRGAGATSAHRPTGTAVTTEPPRGFDVNKGYRYYKTLGTKLTFAMKSKPFGNGLRADAPVQFGLLRLEQGQVMDDDFASALKLEQNPNFSWVTGPILNLFPYFNLGATVEDGREWVFMNNSIPTSATASHVWDPSTNVVNPRDSVNSNQWQILTGAITNTYEPQVYLIAKFTDDIMGRGMPSGQYASFSLYVDVEYYVQYRERIYDNVIDDLGSFQKKL